ncbi:MAG: FAD-binding and (Fe-S)-binding domain-containing protein [Saprospiraceae bacterium]
MTAHSSKTPIPFDQLSRTLEGELRLDELSKTLYSTDASVYRRIPLGVAFPKHTQDLQAIIAFAAKHEIGLIPRTAGTSLAGQCVGDGLVVDVSKHFTEIVSVDVKAKTVTVQPGVIRDELNRFLRKHKLFFGPNTSTSNRCMVGGMVGNNSSGSTSIRYGHTRDKVKSMTVVLADGSVTTFGEESISRFRQNVTNTGLRGNIYRLLERELSDPIVRKRIVDDFPKAEIKRRNTGYAIDTLLDADALSGEDAGIAFNAGKLLCGSEGTLAFTTEITLQLDDLPPPYAMMVVPHFTSIQDCLRMVVPAMEHELYTCEMLDKTILDLTLGNPEQTKNRHFISGDPAAILMLELRAHSEKELQEQGERLLTSIQKAGQSYDSPRLTGNSIDQALELRAAGLGILGNMVGDKKAVACIEDTAVALPDLADYIQDFSALMEKYEEKPVYYAHAGAGELHLRPILNLKKQEDVDRFRQITTETAHLVRRYGGSMSGEHGDGIVRAPYISLIVGEENFALMERIKQAFDPKGIFNPGKIVDAYAMDEQLRYEIDRDEPEIETLFNFSDTEGVLRLAEKCNGAGACLKPATAGGTMCPSYHATNQEKDSTRGRANALREILTNSEKVNKFDSEELKEVFDLCLSCKGCSSECPSTVDVATLKAEFLYQYQKANGASLRSKLFANNDRLNKLGRISTGLTNFVFKNKLTSGWLKSMMGVAQAHELPLLSDQSLRSWCMQNIEDLQPKQPKREVYLFIDEFTDQLDANIGIDAIHVLTKLGYGVRVVEHAISGRAFISKGFLEEAREVAIKNVDTFGTLVTTDLPLIGIEPSAILTFRDEYPRLVGDGTKAKALAKNVFLLDEFLAAEIEAGRITSEDFTKEQKLVKVHGHCHQKALSGVASTLAYLDLPANYHVELIPSGCCGMAGSFGYEKEHFEVSMAVGEQVLFPSVRDTPETTVIAAVGTSCRHQIKVGTQREAVHPITILREALEGS